MKESYYLGQIDHKVIGSAPVSSEAPQTEKPRVVGPKKRTEEEEKALLDLIYRPLVPEEELRELKGERVKYTLGS